MWIKTIVLIGCVLATLAATKQSPKKKEDPRGKRNLYDIGHHLTVPQLYRRISTGPQIPLYHTQFFPGPRSYSPFLQGRPQSLPPPPYAVQMEPLVHYSQRDPFYDTNSLSLNADGQDDLLTDNNHLTEHVYGPQKQIHHQIIERPVYIKEPEPIIEIIIKESNVTLPPPPAPPTPPSKKKEQVQVFYVKYKKDPNGHGKDGIIYDKPVPAISPPIADEQEEAPPPSYHHHEEVVTGPPPPSTTLRTIIKPDSETYHSPSGIKVTFGKEGFDYDKRSNKPEDLKASPDDKQSVQFPQGRQLSPFPPSPRRPEIFSFTPPPNYRQPQPYRPFSQFRQQGPPSFPRPSPTEYSTLPKFPQFNQPQKSLPPPRPVPPQFQRRPVPYQPFDSVKQPPQFRPETHISITTQGPPITQKPILFSQFREQRPQFSQPQVKPQFPQEKPQFPQEKPQFHNEKPQFQQPQPHQQPSAPQYHQPGGQQQQIGAQFQQFQRPQQPIGGQNLQFQQSAIPQQQPQVSQNLHQQPTFSQHQQTTIPQISQNHHQQSRIPQTSQNFQYQHQGIAQHQHSTVSQNLHSHQPSILQNVQNQQSTSQHQPPQHQQSQFQHPQNQHQQQQFNSPASIIPPGGELIQSVPKYEQHISVSEPLTSSRNQYQTNQQQTQYQAQPQVQQSSIKLDSSNNNNYNDKRVKSSTQTQIQQSISSDYTDKIQQQLREANALQDSIRHSSPQFFNYQQSQQSNFYQSTSKPSTYSTSSTTTTTTTTQKPSTTTKDPKVLNAQLPDEVPEDLRQQLLSSGILNHAHISVLDYDKVGDIPISALPPDQLANFFNAGGAQQIQAAGSEPVPSIADRDFDAEASDIHEVTAKPEVQMKVVRYDPQSDRGQQVQEAYVKDDAKQVEPVVLNDDTYNRYLPLKISGTQFPIPDVPELKGKKITSVVVLAPVAYDFSSTRQAREAKSEEIELLEGQTLKDLLKNPTKENFEKFLENEKQTRSDKQAVILLVAGSGADSKDKKEIFMYDIVSKTVSKLDGELSSAFVDAAEANASADTKTSSSNIVETRVPVPADLETEGSENVDTLSGLTDLSNRISRISKTGRSP